MVDDTSRALPAPPETPDIMHFSSADIDQARGVLNRFYYPVTLGTPEGTDGFRLGVEVIQLGPLTVGHLTFAAPVTVLVAHLDAYHVSIPTSGRMRTRHNGLETVATPATGAVFRPVGPVY